MLKNLKIGTKFNLLLMIIFIVSICVSGAILSNVLQQRAQNEITSKALILIKTMNSVRNYTQNRVNPLLAARLETETVFIPETVPAFSATEVFENLRKNPEYQNFLYKEATVDPTNLRDKADSFELQLVERFRNEPKLHNFPAFAHYLKDKYFILLDP